MHDSIDAILYALSQKFNSIFYDREFVGCVKEDLDIILGNDKHVCLLFPKLKPIFLKALRYEALIFGLKVFYIGEGRNRIAVVCKKESLFVEETNGCSESKTTQKVKKNNKIMEEKETPTESVQRRSNRGNRPTQRFYVPPARRTSIKNKVTHVDMELDNVDLIGNTAICSKTVTALTDINTKEEPDDQHTAICISSPESEHSTLSVQEGISINMENFTSNDHTNNTTDETFQKTDDKCDVNTEFPQDLESVPNLEMDLHTCDNNTTAESLKDRVVIMSNLSLEDKNVGVINEGILEKRTIITTNEDYTKLRSNTNTNLYISTDSTNKKIYIDDGDNEIRRTIENINRRSKPIIKHIQPDNTLRIDTNEKQGNSLSTDNRNQSFTFNCHSEETNVSNWEDILDENGELQKEYVGEIVKHIGCDVQILKATNDYSSYQNVLFQDLEHVIELYDFPSTFKTQDIIQLYSDAYQDTMYVKWCDDTHALLVLSTPAQAQRALQIEHEIIKSRPLVEASKIASLVAGCTDLKPAMKRPQTNMQTARRLINTHLGTKVKLSKETLEQERKILLSARERKRMERQNERDAWEGKPRSTR